MVDAMLEKAGDYPGLVDLDSDLKLKSPQLDIAVDREKAAATGVEIDTLGRTLETLLGGRQVTRFKRRRAIRRGGEDRRYRPAEPGGSPPHLCQRARQRDGSAVEPDLDQGDGRACRIENAGIGARFRAASGAGKKEEPRRGECQGSYALHRTHYRPRLTTTGQLHHALGLWQFFDDSLSISSIATSICGHAFTPRDASRRNPPYVSTSARPRSSRARAINPCAPPRPMHNE